jgi:membrane protein
MTNYSSPPTDNARFVPHVDEWVMNPDCRPAPVLADAAERSPLKFWHMCCLGRCRYLVSASAAVACRASLGRHPEGGAGQRVWCRVQSWEPLFVRHSRTLWTGARVLRQTLCDVWAAQAMEWAAALACYGVLSVFPLLLAGAAVASYVVSPSVVTTRLSVFVEGILPAGVVDLDPIVSAAVAARGQVSLSAIVLWVLAGRRILGALVTALDRVSDVDARHETVERRALVELVALAGIGLLFLMALVARSLLGVVWEAVWGTTASSPLAWAVGAMVHLLLLAIAFFALYTVVPHGERNARAALIGAIAATGLFLVARAIFVQVLDRLWASFALIYGPLTLAALLLTWGWLLGLIIVFGGSLASHVKVMVIEGRSASEAEWRHVAQKVAA